MKTSKSRIDEVRNHGSDLDFSTTFNVAFETYKKMALIAGVVLILFVILLFGIAIGIMGGIIGFGVLADSMTDFRIQNLSSAFVAIYIVVTAVVTAITTVFTAGLIKMAYNAHTNQDVNIGTAFEYFKGKYFGELFIAGFILSLVSVGINTGLELAGIPLLGGFISIIISIFTILTIPIIIFADYKAIDAIGASCAIVAKNFFLIVGLVIVAALFSLIGFFGFCIGVFFTIPFIYAMYYSIYLNSVGIEDDSEFNQIGTNWE